MVTTSNKNTVETEAQSIHYNIYDQSLSELGTGILIKKKEKRLVLWA